jgi:hypothetical protein
MKKEIRLAALEQAAKIEKFCKTAQKHVISASVAVGSAVALAVPAFAEGEALTVTDPFSGISFQPIVDTITASLPSVMPVIVTLVGLKKGIFFVLSLISGA